jgi:DNA-binding CsgD family transcriptional regulator
VGREPEVAAVAGFLRRATHNSPVMLVEGEIGIGKTSVLAAARDAARERGWLVLTANPAELEMPLEYTGIADLLDPLPGSLTEALPGPQRRAIRVALLREEAPEPSVDLRTIATAAVTLLRRAAGPQPVLMIVDDLHWLDLPSARVLAFVLRRLPPAPVSLLASVRTGWASGQQPSGQRVSDRPALATDALPPGRLDRLVLGPLSPDAAHELVTSRTPFRPGRRTLLNLVQLTGGNPMFLLELAGRPGVIESIINGQPPDIPSSLGQLVAGRISCLSAGARDLLLVTALADGPSLPVILGTARDPSRVLDDLRQVMAANLLAAADQRVFVTHPLVRSVIVSTADPADRHAAHARLATGAERPEERARHLALSAAGPDEPIAADVEAAAIAAAGRGACAVAADLAELAAALTPPDEPATRQRRMVRAAAHRFDASQPAQARLLLEGVIDSAEPGPCRAELVRRLARYRGHSGQSLPAWAADLEWALREAADHRESRIVINLDRCVVALNSGDLMAARLIAGEALADIERGDGNAALEAQCCAGLALLDFMLCRPPRPDLIRRALAGRAHQPVRLSMELRPNVAIGHVLHWNGDLDGARRLYEEEYRRAREEGIETELPLLLWGLVETETWAGRWSRAEQLAEQGCRAAEEADSPSGVALMFGVRSLLQICRGRLDEGRRDATRSMQAGAELGMSVVPRMCAHALGVAGLSQGDAAGVHELLGPFVQPADWSDGLEPALWRFLPDEIEALVRLGQLGEAQAVLEPYESWSAELGRGFGMAGAARCRGLLLAAHGDLAGAEAALENAISRCGTVPQPFETARTLLTAGEVHRRARHKRLAKMRITDALAIFERLGAPAWAARTRRELACVGLRPAAPHPSSLTAAEQRVAELVVLGHSNGQVAAELFMGRRTVESHLTRIYQKLEVHSRTELCRLLSTSGHR